MKILLGSCLAVMLVGAVPVIAADQTAPPTNQNAPAASTQDNTDTTNVQGPRHRHRAGQVGQAAGQHARAHRARTFEVGQKVRPRFLERHKLENYARFRLETPENGGQWVRARGQFILVGADGRVQDVIQRRHGHRNAGQHRHNRQQQQNQTQDQPDSGDQQSQ